MYRPLRVVTTRVEAFIAVVLTGWVLALHFREQLTSRVSPWAWLGLGFFPVWAVVVINFAFFAIILQLGVALVLAPLRKDEKALLVAFVGDVMLTSIGALFPRMVRSVHVVQTFLILVSFLGAVAILLSFWNIPVSPRRDEPC